MDRLYCKGEDTVFPGTLNGHQVFFEPLALNPISRVSYSFTSNSTTITLTLVILF